MLMYLVQVISLLLISHSCYAQNEIMVNYDANDAYQICGYQTYTFDYRSGYGKVKDDLSDFMCFPNEASETNSMWFRVRFSGNGQFGFSIFPNSENADIDFVVFDALEYEKGNIDPIRCHAAGENFGNSKNSKVEEGACLGEVGLSMFSNEEISSWGCNVFENKYLKWIEVKESDEILIFVNNLQHENGFRIHFFGNAPISNECQSGMLLKNPPKINVFPNPLTENLNIELYNILEGPISFQILSPTGQLINSFYQQAQKNEDQLKLKWDLSQYPNGAYLLRVYVNGQIISHKITKI